MSVQLDKLKFGFATDINSQYAVVGNPSAFYLNNTFVGTGSIEIYYYDTVSNVYSRLYNLRKSFFDTLLAVDTSSLDETLLNTDNETARGFNILINSNPDLVAFSDGYGISLALSASTLVVGCPYHYTKNTDTDTTIENTGSIDIYDLSELENTSSIISPAYVIYNTSSLDVDDTFAESVSINGNVIVAGSSRANNTSGSIYIYTQSLSNTWHLYQSFSGSAGGHYYGGNVKIDPSGSYRIVVGHKSTGSFGVDVYDYNTNNSRWAKTTTLSENTSLTGSLNFIDHPPYVVATNSSSNFGHSVAVYDDYVIVGAANDMYYYEYDGSDTLRNRGAVYFYHKCANDSGWMLLQKSYGNDELLKTNDFGKQVSISDGYAVVTNTSIISNRSSSFITASLNKKFDCSESDYVTDMLGQAIVYQLNTSSIETPVWDIVGSINKKKAYGAPYVSYGYDVSIQDRKIIIGAPLFLVDPENMESELSGIKGYSYIYDMDDLLSNVKIGNVFYRNGKFILSNSGSVFDKILKSKLDFETPKYDITYKSQLTVYEKQIICTISPGDFNYSTNPTALVTNEFTYDIDQNHYFDFVDLDLIFRYICYKIHGNYLWYNYITFDSSDYDWFTYYYDKYKLTNKDDSYMTQYISKLESIYSLIDVDGNKKINFNEVYILLKYFTNRLTKDVVFKHTEPRSTRKSVEDITSYIDTKIGKTGYGVINPLFFQFDSSSIDKTGSYLAPYITSVGLYSGADLIAIAKLGMPIKNTGELPLNIIIKLDI